jgi:hypothetical protein
LTTATLTPALGGGLFQKLACLLGPVAAARCLHRIPAVTIDPTRRANNSS